MALTAPDDQAFPDQAAQVITGLTKREYFATAALALIRTTLDVPGDHNYVAYHAVKIADALIAELNRVPPQ